ncbi:uracil-DNA glycosylase, partial [uncultured Parasutterella sp.]
QTLKQLVQDCRACEISSSRLHPVFGQGNPPCRLMLIGEAPGAEEDRLGQPFVGPSGKLLDKILEAAKLDREKDLCIFNTLKCRPPLNATPEKAETMACRPFLERQIELIDPEVIVAMGKPAASWFFPDLKTLNPYRGKVHNLTVQGKPRKVIVTYHPSYLLRSPQEKRKAWLDWCLILDTLS